MRLWYYNYITMITLNIVTLWCIGLWCYEPLVLRAICPAGHWSCGPTAVLRQGIICLVSWINRPIRVAVFNVDVFYVLLYPTRLAVLFFSVVDETRRKKSPSIFCWITFDLFDEKTSTTKIATHMGLLLGWCWADVANNDKQNILSPIPTLEKQPPEARMYSLMI